ncbi:hypothetical protein PM082_011312 [Marasmius tenuissimus]|nr:hypothetical protein PM082_011312 [Marasmius tenuissimus]
MEREGKIHLEHLGSANGVFKTFVFLRQIENSLGSTVTGELRDFCSHSLHFIVCHSSNRKVFRMENYGKRRVSRPKKNGKTTMEIHSAQARRVCVYGSRSRQ